MKANERFEYMAELFFKATGHMAPGKDSCAAFGVTDTEERDRKWGEFIAVFYSELFDLHKSHNRVPDKEECFSCEKEFEVEDHNDRDEGYFCDDCLDNKGG